MSEGQNYRRISLIPIAVNLLSIIIRHNVSAALEELAHEAQADYRPGSAGVDQIVSYWNDRRTWYFWHLWRLRQC